MLLVLANIGLAAWFFWDRAPMPLSDSSPVAHHSGERRLRTLRELPSSELVVLETSNAEPPSLPAEPLPQLTALVAGEPDATVEPAPEGDTLPEVPAVAQSASCLRIANIDKKVVRDTLAAKLLAQDLMVLERGEAFEERQTYWVYLPPFKSAAAAREGIATLTKLKQRDFMLVRVGEFENAISLGLFSQQEGAEKRLKEINALGLKTRPAEIRTRTASFRSYWLLAKTLSEEEAHRLRALIPTTVSPPLPADCPP